jgi:medium-chain acyl-[acyl-carrier-protein] hydrolase
MIATPRPPLAWWTSAAPTAPVQLLCFPYAGGTTSVFRPWVEPLAGAVRLHIPRLPGRESRLRERGLDDLRALLPYLASTLEVEPPYAMFGHSLGAIVAFELARYLRSAGRALPVHLFVSAAPAPHLKKPLGLGAMSGDRLWARLRELNGVPAALLDDPELLELLEPILKADFGIDDRYVYTAAPALPCAITVLRGAADPNVSAASAAAWAQHTTGAFAAEVLDGDHFFLHAQRERVVAMIRQTLLANNASGS